MASIKYPHGNAKYEENLREYNASVERVVELNAEISQQLANRKHQYVDIPKIKKLSRKL